MKNLLYKIAFSVIAVIFLFSCETRDEAENFRISAGENGEIPVLTVSVGESSFFDLTNLNTAKVNLTIDVADGSASSVEVYKTFNDPDASPILVSEVSSFPAEIEVTANQAVEGTGVAVEDLEPGDTFYFTFIMVAGGKEISSSGTAVSIASACPSVISTEEDTWSATGTNENGFGLPTTSSAEGITISPLGGGNYLISDISAGWYASIGYNATQEGIYNDICNTISWVEPGEDRQFTFADPGIKGSWDPETQTLVVYWFDSGNGITGESIYTKN